MFDFPRFLKDAFGRPAALVKLLRAYGVDPPKYAAAQKWFQRGSVPADWFALLLAYLTLERGEPPDLCNYLKV